jgi:hypothetical protein
MGMALNTPRNGRTGAGVRRLTVASARHAGRYSETGGSQEPLPIWLAVLIATSCQARSNDGRHDIQWNRVAGRAVYTNYGRDAERIEPLGVNLLGGETLAVCWTPGETAYTLEIYNQTEKCA